MVDWKDPRVMATEARTYLCCLPILFSSNATGITVDFNNVVHVFFGLYMWELMMSFYFEISLMKGKRKVGWPLVRGLQKIDSTADLSLECVINHGQKVLDFTLIDCKVPFFLCRYGMLWALTGL